MTKAMLSPVFGIACAASLSLMLWFSYKTGCAGDLKSGAYGDMQLAMRYDGASGASLILSVALGAAAIFVASRKSPRIRYAAVGIVPAAILMWLVGWQFQDWGVQSCFPR